MAAEVSPLKISAAALAELLATPLDAAPKRRHAWAGWKCEACGTDTTPERRAGPAGRNSMCNRCGLKYAKAKKRHRLELKQRDEQRIRAIMSFDALIHQPMSEESTDSIDAWR